MPPPYLLPNKLVESSSNTVSLQLCGEFLYSSRPVAIFVNTHGRSPYLRLLQLFNALPRERSVQLGANTFYRHKHTREAVTPLSLRRLPVLNAGKVTWLGRKATTFERRFCLSGCIRTATIKASGETGKEPHAYTRGWGTALPHAEAEVIITRDAANHYPEPQCHYTHAKPLAPLSAGPRYRQPSGGEEERRGRETELPPFFFWWCCCRRCRRGGARSMPSPGSPGGAGQPPPPPPPPSHGGAMGRPRPAARSQRPAPGPPHLPRAPRLPGGAAPRRGRQAHALAGCRCSETGRAVPPPTDPRPPHTTHTHSRPRPPRGYLPPRPSPPLCPRPPAPRRRHRPRPPPGPPRPLSAAASAHPAAPGGGQPRRGPRPGRPVPCGSAILPKARSAPPPPPRPPLPATVSAHRAVTGLPAHRPPAAPRGRAPPRRGAADRFQVTAPPPSWRRAEVARLPLATAQAAGRGRAGPERGVLRQGFPAAAAACLGVP